MNTTFQKPVALQCPICENNFTAFTWNTSVDTIATRWTDGSMWVNGYPVRRYDVFHCRKCGFAGTKYIFENIDPIDKLMLGVRLADFANIYPINSRTYFEINEVAAGIYKQLGINAIEQGLHYAIAACECIVADDIEAERYYRLKAARTWLAAVDNWGEVSSEKLPEVLLVSGEMFRRAGLVKGANELFKRLIELQLPSTQHWLQQLARVQMVVPQHEMPTLDYLNSITVEI
jgi:hypothetical protein